MYLLMLFLCKVFYKVHLSKEIHLKLHQSLQVCVNSLLFCIVYLYSIQYLHVLQDSKCYMTSPSVQVQSDSQITDFP